LVIVCEFGGFILPNYIFFKKEDKTYMMKSSVEDFLKQIGDDRYDVNFGMAGGDSLDSILEENPEFYPYKLINRLDDVL
jgi:hypothetical protein